jgi:hypothetical protein
MRHARILIIKVLASVTVFGGVYAMAATLGGVTPGALGADDAAVASCDSDGVTTAFTSGWSASAKAYAVSAVGVSGIASACNGQTVKVTLVDSGGASLAEGTATADASGSKSVSISGAPLTTTIARVHVTIAS